MSINDYQRLKILEVWDFKPLNIYLLTLLQQICYNHSIVHLVNSQWLFCYRRTGIKWSYYSFLPYK